MGVSDKVSHLGRCFGQILTLISVLTERNRMASCGAGHKREKSPYLSSSTIFERQLKVVFQSILQRCEWNLQWRPIQMRAFHSNENGLFCTHPLSVALLLFFGGRKEASRKL